MPTALECTIRSGGARNPARRAAARGGSIPRRITIIVALGLLASFATARAWVHEGQVAPAFTKSTLAGGPPWSSGPPISLAGLSGKVVVLFLMGCT